MDDGGSRPIRLQSGSLVAMVGHRPDAPQAVRRPPMKALGWFMITVARVLLTVALVLLFPVALIAAVLAAVAGADLDPRWVSDAIQAVGRNSGGMDGGRSPS